eukprot:1598104-Amphidinium_carterae.1
MRFPHVGLHCWGDVRPQAKCAKCCGRPEAGAVGKAFCHIDSGEELVDSARFPVPSLMLALQEAASERSTDSPARLQAEEGQTDRDGALIVSDSSKHSLAHTKTMWKIDLTHRVGAFSADPTSSSDVTIGEARTISMA